MCGHTVVAIPKWDSIQQEKCNMATHAMWLELTSMRLSERSARRDAQSIVIETDEAILFSIGMNRGREYNMGRSAHYLWS